jgi:hypothetical protein
MTTRAGPLEVPLAGVRVAGLKVGEIDRAPAAGQRGGQPLLVVNERDDGGSVGVAQRERRHALVDAARAQQRPDLVAATSSATIGARVRSGPVSPPIASRPWQKPHCAEKIG